MGVKIFLPHPSPNSFETDYDHQCAFSTRVTSMFRRSHLFDQRKPALVVIINRSALRPRDAKRHLKLIWGSFLMHHLLPLKDLKNKKTRLMGSCVLQWRISTQEADASCSLKFHRLAFLELGQTSQQDCDFFGIKRFPKTSILPSYFNPNFRNRFTHLLVFTSSFNFAKNITLFFQALEN